MTNPSLLPVFTDVQAKIIRFCAEEVSRQQDQPLAVAWMLDAWNYALVEYAADPELTLAHVRIIGRLVKQDLKEDVFSNGGWRPRQVWVGHHKPPEAWQLPGLMAAWLDDANERLSPEEAYRTFEVIHPFFDGNGRSGKIIYSWLRGELESPTLPPNFFGSTNS